MASQRSSTAALCCCSLSLLVVGGGVAWLYYSNKNSRTKDKAATAAEEKKKKSSSAAIDDGTADAEKDSANDDDLPLLLLPPPCSLPPPCVPILIETFDQLRSVAEKSLKRAKAIGVDVEHSSSGAYRGRVCAIQLSCAVAQREGNGEGKETREESFLETLAETYVVDVVALCRNSESRSESGNGKEKKENDEQGGTARAFFSSLLFFSAPSSPPPQSSSPEERIAELLRPCLSDPSVLKVFHNGASDLTWLQRDFPSLAAGAKGKGGVGISPVADTARLARALGLRSDGLPAVLEFAAREAAAGGSSGNEAAAAAAALRAVAERCAATKAEAQRGDWLSRPLSPAALLYAALDAHYLPFAAFLMSRRLEESEEEGAEGGEEEEEEGEKRASGDDTTDNNNASAAVAVARESLAAGLAVRYRPVGPEAAARAAARRIISRSSAAGDDGENGGKTFPLLLSRGAFADAALALCRWRDSLARELDVPAREVLPDEGVAALAGLTGAHGGCGGGEGEGEGEEGASAALVVAVAERAIVASSSPSSFLPHLRTGAAAAAAAIDEALHGLHRWEEEAEAPSSSSFARGGGSGELGDDGDFERRGTAATTTTRLGRAIQRFAAKRPVYHSCRLLSREGELLAFVDRKKLLWYVHKGLAEVVEEETDDENEEEGASPKEKKKKSRVSAARLLFEHARFGAATATTAEGKGTAAEATAAPSSAPHSALPDLFSASPRENRCVGCGERGHYLRYRVLPGCYRAALPPRLKAHASHDVVLLCVPCHERAMAGAHALKRRLAQELSAPLDPESRSWRAGKLGVPSGADSADAAAAARTAAVTLARHGERMPAERRAELERVVWEAIGGGGSSEEGEERGDGKTPLRRRALPPKEALAAKLVAASSSASAAGVLVRRDAQRLYRALGVTLASREEDEEEEEEEEKKESEEGEGEDPDDCESRLSKRCRPRAAAAVVAPPLSSLPGRRTGGGHRAHGLAVVRALASSAGKEKDENESGNDGTSLEPALDALAARFRRAFVAAVAPRFLPLGWDVDAPLGRRAHGPYSAVVRAEEEARERSAAEARERRKKKGKGKGREEVAAFAF